MSDGGSFAGVHAIPWSTSVLKARRGVRRHLMCNAVTSARFRGLNGSALQSSLTSSPHQQILAGSTPARKDRRKRGRRRRLEPLSRAARAEAQAQTPQKHSRGHPRERRAGTQRWPLRSARAARINVPRQGRLRGRGRYEGVRCGIFRASHDNLTGTISMLCRYRVKCKKREGNRNPHLSLLADSIPQEAPWSSGLTARNHLAL